MDEKYKYGFLYTLGLSSITPPLIAYNLNKIYSQPVSPPWITGTFRMMPAQLAMRIAQLKVSTEIKERTNPWIAFSTIGIIQGFIYGHSITHWAKYMKLPPNTSPNMFRGILFAASRDTISQGIPFAMSNYGLGAVIGSSIISTTLSQGLHNCQSAMQLNNKLSYSMAVKKMFRIHGWKFLYKGVEARLTMMGAINIMNYLFLKKIWKNE